MPAYANGHSNGNGHGHHRPHGRNDAIDVPTDQLPPQNLGAEQGVLGSILLDNDVLHEVVPILQIEDFYRDSHQIVFRTIRELYDLGKAVDSITLAEELIRRDLYDRIGGNDGLAEILELGPTRGQCPLLCRDRPPEGDRPRADPKRQRDHPRGLRQHAFGRRAARNRRAPGLPDRRGPDQGGDGRTARRRHEGDGPHRLAERVAAPDHRRRHRPVRPGRHHRRVPARAARHPRRPPEHG